MTTVSSNPWCPALCSVVQVRRGCDASLSNDSMCRLRCPCDIHDAACGPETSGPGPVMAISSCARGKLLSPPRWQEALAARQVGHSGAGHTVVTQQERGRHGYTMFLGTILSATHSRDVRHDDRGGAVATGVWFCDPGRRPRCAGACWTVV